MPSFKKITKEIFGAIAEIPFVLDIAFSQKSLCQKEMLLGGFKPWQVNHTLKRFQKTGYIANEKGKLKLTKLGIDRINYYKLAGVTFDFKSKKWDKKWRVIVFDIPESQRNARDLLRNKLREWNCYKVQNSVFVCPYACEKELRQVTEILAVKDCVCIFLANDLGLVKDKLTRYYKL